MWDVRKQPFLSVADKHVPLKTKRMRHRLAPWLTPELKRLIINCKHLKQKANSTGDPNDWSKYKVARNKLNNNIRLAKSAYYHKEIEDNIGNSRQTWKTINNLMSRKTKDSSINELKVKNVIVNEPSEIADELNKHFTDIGNKLAVNLSQSDSDYQQFSRFWTVPCSSLTRPAYLFSPHIRDFLPRAWRAFPSFQLGRTWRKHHILITKLV